MSRFLRKLKKSARKILYASVVIGAMNLASHGAVSFMDSRLPNPKSYRCSSSSLPYCNKPNTHYGNIRINSEGYIGDKEFSSKKPANTYRIALFGGSTSLPFCQTEKRDDAAFHLESILNEHYRNLEFEVWNASIIGYSVREHSIAIRDFFGPNKNIDMAIIQEPINHIYLCFDLIKSWDNLLQMEKTNFRRLYAATPLSEAIYRFYDFTRSFVYEVTKNDKSPFELIRETISSIQSKKISSTRPEYVDIINRYYGPESRSKHYEQIKGGLPTVWNSLERIYNVSRQHNFQVVLGIMPMIFTKDHVDGLGVPFTPSCASKEEIYKTYYDFNEATRKTYEAFADKFKLPLIRHDTSFENIPFDDLGSKYFCDFVHLQDEGHEIIANNLAWFIFNNIPDTQEQIN